jgi:hypothetical protein
MSAAHNSALLRILANGPAPIRETYSDSLTQPRSLIHRGRPNCALADTSGSQSFRNFFVAHETEKTEARAWVSIGNAGKERTFQDGKEVVAKALAKTLESWSDSDLN